MSFHHNKKALLLLLFLAVLLMLTGCSCSHKDAALINVREATCTENGYTGDRYCAKCETVLEQGQSLDLLPHQPSETVNFVPPVCAQDGYTGDKYCVVCGAVCVQGISIPALGHSPDSFPTNTSTPTCTENGYTGDILCRVCGEVCTAGEIIPAAGHTAAEARLGVTDVTCTADGYTGDVLCTVCNAVLEAGETLPAPGHTPNDQLIGAQSATCYNDGYTGDIRCTKCKLVIEAGVSIPKVDHQPGNPVGAKAADCVTAGFTGTRTCTYCGLQLDAGTVIAPLGHTPSVGNCEEDKQCTSCGETIKGSSHSYKVATATEPAQCVLCGDTWGEPLTIPFYCNGEVVAAAKHLIPSDLLSRYFTEETYYLRTEEEAIDHYSSTERVMAIYDDGKDVLLTSDSGFYFGNVENATTTRLYAFLDTDLGIYNSSSGYVSLTVYKSPGGYWIAMPEQQIFIDTANEKLYMMKTKKGSYFASMNDRYVAYQEQEGLLLIDRNSCEAQFLPLKGITHIPYFNTDGMAVMKINGSPAIHYYYTWNNACAQLVSYSPNVVYVDDTAIMVEEEFSFNKIQNGETVWKIKKKDIALDQSVRQTHFQTGVLWQYGNESSHYSTFLVPKEQPLLTYDMGAPENEKVDNAYFVGWSGRFSDCHNYDYTDHSIDHKSVFDHISMKVYALTKYHRSNRIYNQTHVLWDRNLQQDMGGDYGVYTFHTKTYNQRNIIQ